MICLNKEDKNSIIKLITIFIIISTILFIIHENNRYELIHKEIKVNVLSVRVQTDEERSMGKFRRDVKNVYISFEYNNDIYNDFKLGEEDKYKNIEPNNIITLDLCEIYKDGILKQNFIQP